ncbi:hypothetical protein [uncultured Roseobacter sp.]|nr:hypothetical protein [uncultured Roseobacter sp.]
MLLRLIVVLAILYFGYKFASGALFVVEAVLTDTFAWMFEDY